MAENLTISHLSIFNELFNVFFIYQSKGMQVRSSSFCRSPIKTKDPVDKTLTHPSVPVVLNLLKHLCGEQIGNFCDSLAKQKASVCTKIMGYEIKYPLLSHPSHKTNPEKRKNKKYPWLRPRVFNSGTKITFFAA